MDEVQEVPNKETSFHMPLLGIGELYGKSTKKSSVSCVVSLVDFL